jgi:hypothetical protein
LYVRARAKEELREWMAVELAKVKTRSEKEMRDAVEKEFQAKWSEKAMLKTSVKTELKSEVETKFVTASLYFCQLHRHPFAQLFLRSCTNIQFSQTDSFRELRLQFFTSAVLIGLRIFLIFADS